MRLRVLSDLHLEHFVACQTFDPGSGDILVLAGDILCAKHLKTSGYLSQVYKSFLNRCASNYDHVVYVLGNHEFWGYNYEGAKKHIALALPDNFELLDNSCVKIGPYKFIGSTLWTNFRNGDPIEMFEAECKMNDYSSIRIGSNFRKFRATDSLRIHRESIEFIESELQTTDPVIVVSHHAPSFQSVDPSYSDSSINSAFCSDLSDLVLRNSVIKYWFHGHLHSRSDYTIGDCRVICNPVGYRGHDSSYDPDSTWTI